MELPIFLSSPKPYCGEQDTFIETLKQHLKRRKLFARTVGVTDYDNELPLRVVRRLMLESNGVITVALRRYRVTDGASKPGSLDEVKLANTWFTSPWPHIETAMGYQLGLPIMVLRESGTCNDGVLQVGIVDKRVIEVDVTKLDEFFNGGEWTDCLDSWAHDVRSVAKKRGMPRRLY